MIKKVIKSILWIYMLQITVTSCCYFVRSDCDTYTTIEFTYNDMFLNYYMINLEDSEPKNSLILHIEIIPQEEEISYDLPKKVNGINFNSAYASQPCCQEFYDYIFLDSINSIKIFVKNLDNNETTDVTNNFKIVGNNYNNDDSNDFALYLNNHHQIELLLENFENIPDKSTFEVRVSLNSEKEFSQETEVINFNK